MFTDLHIGLFNLFTKKKCKASRIVWGLNCYCFIRQYVWNLNTFVTFCDKWLYILENIQGVVLRHKMFLINNQFSPNTELVLSQGHQNAHTKINNSIIYLPSKCHKETWKLRAATLLAWMVIGLILAGTGAVPQFPLGLTYLEDRLRGFGTPFYVGKNLKGRWHNAGIQNIGRHHEFALKWCFQRSLWYSILILLNIIELDISPGIYQTHLKTDWQTLSASAQTLSNVEKESPSDVTLWCSWITL